MNQGLKVVCLISSFLFLFCQPDKSRSSSPKLSTAVQEAPISNKQFNDYWYAGKAELNSYSLKQARYGELHEGEVVLVFVTEPFSQKKQVKLDYPQSAGKDNVSVMKLNQIRKFTTGIYDYSIASSTFTPVDLNNHPHTIKSNTSIQEWCGHTFTQLNLKENNYQVEERSYFETEGDSEASLPVAMLEEELMTRIRLTNGQLPLGEVDMIASILHSRFTHQKLKTTKAKISKKESDTTMTYHIVYSNVNRKISIEVQKEFPYRILGWTEDDGRGLVTEAKLKKSMNEAYWNQKNVKDEVKRKELELER